ncbi:MAG: hypothetical protein MUP98_15430 [Candidatus Aminicenantes bacterium]|nr:hypothetical protein [Candidatus Aminicenantes bacterium]
MTKKALFASFLLILLTTSFCSVLFAVDYAGQEKKETELAPKYTAFLAEAQPLMTEAEKEVFLSLENDRERDVFIESFWKSRGGRRPGVRANINLLMLTQMVRILDLNEDQIAKILPVMNQNEREKQDLQREINGHMRVLQMLIREDPSSSREDKEELHSAMSGKLDILRQLKKSLREKEIAFELFLTENLTLLQQARYVIFSQEFYRGLREKLDEARRTQERLQQPKRIKR